MWKKWRYRLLLIGVVTIAPVAYFEPTYCVRGWLHGEAFFDGRPTSWWRAELERWDFKVQPDGGVLIGSRRQTMIEKVRVRWLGQRREIDLFPGVYFFGNDEEIPVLTELSNDPCPRIRDLARASLKK